MIRTDRTSIRLGLSSLPMAMAAFLLAVPLAAHPGAKTDRQAGQPAQEQQEKAEAPKPRPTGLTLKDVVENASWRSKTSNSLN